MCERERETQRERERSKRKELWRRNISYAVSSAHAQDSWGGVRGEGGRDTDKQANLDSSRVRQSDGLIYRMID